MKRKLIPVALASAILMGGLGCNNNNSPPFSRLVVPANVAVSTRVTTAGQTVRLSTPGFSQAGPGAFDLQFPAGAMDLLLAQYGPLNVSAQAVTLNELTLGEQQAILASSNGGVGVLSMVGFNATPLNTSGAALFTQNLKTKQNTGGQGQGCATASAQNETNNACHTKMKVKNQSGRRCTPGRVVFVQVQNLQALIRDSFLEIDDEFPIQNIIGDAFVAQELLHYIMCWECPRVTPTASPTASVTPAPTATPTPSPTASSVSGPSGQSGTAGGAGNNGQQSAGGGANQ